MKECHSPDHSDSEAEYDKAEIEVLSLSWESEKLKSSKEQLDKHYMESVQDKALRMRLPRKRVVGVQTDPPPKVIKDVPWAMRTTELQHSEEVEINSTWTTSLTLLIWSTFY
jgi:hypothetical protein